MRIVKIMSMDVRNSEFKRKQIEVVATFMNGTFRKHPEPHTNVSTVHDRWCFAIPKKYNRSSQKSSATNTCVDFFYYEFFRKKAVHQSIIE